jgi:hypothetical protein
MYAQYSIPAVVFSGQQHARLEVLKLIFDAVKTPDDCFGFILILELFRDLDQFRDLLKLIRKIVVGIQTVLERLLFF